MDKIQEKTNTRAMGICIYWSGTAFRPSSDELACASEQVISLHRPKPKNGSISITVKVPRHYYRLLGTHGNISSQNS